MSFLPEEWIPVSLDVCKSLCCFVDWFTTVTRVYVHDFICLASNKTSDMQIFDWKKNTGLTKPSLIRVKKYNFMVKVVLYLHQCNRYSSLWYDAYKKN